MILVLTAARVAAMAGRKQRRNEAGRVLATVGLRPTPQRLDVLAELMGEPDDLTAQDLHERLRGRGARLGLATVYRTLNALADEGVIDALSHRQGELCYRWCGDEHHHHLVCASCHRVVELADCELDPWLQRVSAQHGFVATGHRLEVAGLCAECRA
jgi:Fur family transcriptional regulator, ferric uptake regulator